MKNSTKQSNSRQTIELESCSQFGSCVPEVSIENRFPIKSTEQIRWVQLFCKLFKHKTFASNGFYRVLRRIYSVKFWSLSNCSKVPLWRVGNVSKKTVYTLLRGSGFRNQNKIVKKFHIRPAVRKDNAILVRLGSFTINQNLLAFQIVHSKNS